MSNVIPWRQRATVSEAAKVAPTDGEFRMLVAMLDSMRAELNQRFQALDARLDRQDRQIEANHSFVQAEMERRQAALQRVSDEVVSAKARVGVWQGIATFLGLGGVVGAIRWFLGSNG